jgi:hypothetical protein
LRASTFGYSLVTKLVKNGFAVAHPAVEYIESSRKSKFLVRYLLMRSVKCFLNAFQTIATQNLWYRYRQLDLQCWHNELWFCLWQFLVESRDGKNQSAVFMQ